MAARSDFPTLLTYFTFSWTMFWQVLCVGIVIWTLLIGRLWPEWWFYYHLTTTVVLAVVVAVPTTVWFVIGVSRDLWELLHTLRTADRNDADDGTVRDHYNAEDETRPALLQTDGVKVPLTT